MKRSVLLATAAVVLFAPAAFGQSNNGRSEVNLGIGQIVRGAAQAGRNDRVNDAVDLTETQETVSRTVDYANTQSNFADQTAILEMVSDEVGEISGTAAAIGNSYSLDAAANVVADINQGNDGNVTAIASAAVSRIDTAGITSASIGNTASIASEVATISTTTAQTNNGDMTAVLTGVALNVNEVSMTAASIGNSLSVEIPGGGDFSGIQNNNGAMVSELNGSLTGFADAAATAASIGNSYSLTSLNSGVAGNVASSLSQLNGGNQLAVVRTAIGRGGEAAATAAAIGNSVSITVD